MAANMWIFLLLRCNRRTRVSRCSMLVCQNQQNGASSIDIAGNRNRKIAEHKDAATAFLAYFLAGMEKPMCSCRSIRSTMKYTAGHYEHYCQCSSCFSVYFQSGCCDGLHRYCKNSIVYYIMEFHFSPDQEPSSSLKRYNMDAYWNGMVLLIPKCL